MKGAWILAGGVATPERAERLRDDPGFRKATPGMAMVAAAVESSLADFSAEWRNENSERIAVVLGTSHGELDVTLRFLKTLGSTGAARPLLFQNSLHNSTLGFLQERFRLRGPAMAVTGRYFSGEEALDLGLDLLQMPEVRYALVVAADGLVTDGESAFRATYPEGFRIRSGAAAVVLAGEDALGDLPALRPLGAFEGWSKLEGAVGVDLEYYDANAVEKLVRALVHPSERLHLPKPNGQAAEIRLTVFPKSPA